jgi:hypothetical protein
MNLRIFRVDFTKRAITRHGFCSCLFLGAAAFTSANVYHFSLHKTRDDSHGIVAYTCLIPSGWTAQEKCLWGQEYGFEREVTSPDRSCVLTELYNLESPFQFIGGQLKQGNAPPRSLSGMLIQLCQKAHPDVRFQIAKRSEKPLPEEIARQRRANFGAQASVELRFEKNGVPSQITAQAEMSGHDYGQGGSGRFSVHSGSWNIDLALVVEGPVAKQRELAKDFVVLLSSNRDTAAFDRVDAEFSHQTNQNANNQIRLDGEISKRIATSARQREDAIMGRSKDGSSSSYLDFLGNAETYKDPITNEDVQLSNGYKDAWTDGNGNYILSDDVSYDPNRGSNGTWRRERKKR